MKTEKREYTIGHTTYIVITHYNNCGETLANLIKRLITKYNVAKKALNNPAECAIMTMSYSAD